MSNEQDSKLMEKIRAILRKAEESSNESPEERDTAMRMAQRLLLKHGLSMQDVGSLDEADDGREFERSSAALDLDLSEHWKGTLLYRISRVYFVQAYYTSLSRKRRTWSMVGRADHIAATKAMYEYVWPQIQLELNVATSKMGLYQRIARRYALAVAGGDPGDDEALAEIGRKRLEAMTKVDASAGADDIARLCDLRSSQYAKNAMRFIRRGEIAPSDTTNLKVWRNSFLDNAISRVASRLRELQNEEVEDLGDAGTALVRNERAELDNFLESLNLGLRSSHSSRQYDSAGALAGREAGDRADLSGHRKMSNNVKELNR